MPNNALRKKRIRKISLEATGHSQVSAPKPSIEAISRILGIHEEGSSAFVDTFVIERLNLLGDTFIQNRVHLPGAGRLPEQMGFESWGQ